MAVVIAHAASDADSAAWLAEKLKPSERRILLRNIDDPRQTTKLDDNRRAFNEVDVVLPILSAATAASTRMNAEIDFVSQLQRERRTLQLIPVLAEGGAWPASLSELKYVRLADGENSIALLQAAIELPHFMTATDSAAYQVAFARRGLPFGQRNSVVAATGFGIPDGYMIFPLLQADGANAELASMMCSLAMYDLATAASEQKLLRGDIDNDARAIVRVLDESVKAINAKNHTSPALHVGLRLALLFAVRDQLAVFTIGRMGGLLASSGKDQSGRDIFQVRTLDAKFVVSCNPGANRDLLYSAPIGALADVSRLEPRTISFGSAPTFVCMTNWVLSVEQSNAILPEIITARNTHQAAGRLANFAASEERRKGFANFELMTVMFSTNGFFGNRA